MLLRADIGRRRYTAINVTRVWRCVVERAQDKFSRAAESLRSLRRRHNDALLTEARALANALSGVPTVVRVILFGSVATGRATATSDIDLALVANVPPTWSRGERGMAMLQNLHPTRDLDLVVYTPEEFERLGRRDAAMKRAILEEGVVLFERH